MTVAKVLDHSTIVVARNQKVSLIGVDKPPTGAFTVRDAKDHLSDILRGKEVMLVADPLVVDRKGCKARYVYIKGDLVNVRVISEGFAGVDRSRTFSKLDAFLETESVARRMKVGAWVLDASQTDEQFSLAISPNPVTEVAMLQYQIPETCNVSLLIIDSTNRVVASLVNARMNAGGYTAVFQRLRLPDGVYRCQLSAGSRIIAEDLALIGRSSSTSSYQGPNTGFTTESDITAGTEADSTIERKSFTLPGSGTAQTTSKP